MVCFLKATHFEENVANIVENTLNLLPHKKDFYVLFAICVNMLKYSVEIYNICKNRLLIMFRVVCRYQS